MTDRDHIKFLGTAGARFVVAQQLRFSAGVFLGLKGKAIILDPGPGTLVRCARSKPPIDVAGLDAVILTHAHIDHTNDVNILIDAMTGGGLKKRGVLLAPRECLDGDNAVVLKYLRAYLEDIVTLESEREYGIGDLTFSTSVRHQHPVETYGVRFDVEGRRVSFLVDTQYFLGLAESYRGSDVLVVNVVRHRPHESGDVMHLSVDDVRRLIAETRPGKVIMTHFGMTMLRAKPWVIASELSAETGVEVIAASDGMTVEL
jgi:phosphoribosyl 1,2-cyclic phosphodiesterase